MDKQHRSDADTAHADPTHAPESAAADPAATAGAVQAAAQVVVQKLTAQQAQGAGAATTAQPALRPAEPSFLARAEAVISNSGEKVVQDAVALAGGVKRLAVDVGQHLEVVGAEAVGVAELAGFRYSVKAYEAQVDGGLYRGSRVDDAGMASLKQQGIKGVVSLCLEHTEDAALAAKYGIEALNVKILDNTAPTIAQMMDFIHFAQSHAPTYVHCEAGKGRTGTAVACYRIAVDGWTAERAIAEARTYGLSLINQIAFIRKFGESIHGPEAAPVAADPAKAAAPPPAGPSA